MTTTDDNMTLAALAKWLDDRDLVMVLHSGRNVAFAYAPDDPAIHVTGEGETLPEAVAQAMRGWDRESVVES